MPAPVGGVEARSAAAARHPRSQRHDSLQPQRQLVRSEVEDIHKINLRGHHLIFYSAKT